MSESPPPPYQDVDPRQQTRDPADHSMPARGSSKKTWLRLSTPSWMYPFSGVYYFASHRFLWPLLRARLLPCFLLSIIVLTTLFIWAYLPQVAFLAIFHGFNASAWINGAFLVLGEGAAIIALFFEAFFVDETLVDIFDAVLVNEGYAELVAKGREVSDDANLNALQRLGKPASGVGRIYSPFSLRQIAEFIFFLPLNFIPWVGVPLFLLITGFRAGPLQHWRYFKFLGMDKKQRKRAEKKMNASYTWFGTVHLALQLIPGFSMLFLLTTAVGSALWVANLEKRKAQLTAVHSAGAVADDYTDNPV